MLEVLEHVDRIRSEHGLIDEAGDRNKFSQGAARAVLLDRSSNARKREIYRQIGLVLEGKVEVEEFREVSDHFYLAEVREKCVCFSLRVGHRALMNGSWQEAESHFQKVMDATDGVGFLEERPSSRRGWQTPSSSRVIGKQL